MKTRKVKDLMVPLEEYATVGEEASLHAPCWPWRKHKRNSGRTDTSTVRFLSSTRANMWWASSVNSM